MPSLNQRVEEQLRLAVEALRGGANTEAFDPEGAIEDCLAECPQPGRLKYTRGIAQQLAELGRLSGGRAGSDAALIFAAAVVRCTRAPHAGPQMCLQLARDPAVAR